MNITADLHMTHISLEGANPNVSLSERVKTRIRSQSSELQDAAVPPSPAHHLINPLNHQQPASPTSSMAPPQKRGPDAATPGSRPAKQARGTAQASVRPQTLSTAGGKITLHHLAEIANYALPGEDLDWTAVEDRKPRHSMQSIIRARKAKEKKHLARGGSGSGNDYKGAAGVRAYLADLKLKTAGIDTGIEDHAPLSPALSGEAAATRMQVVVSPDQDTNPAGTDFAFPDVNRSSDISFPAAVLAGDVQITHSDLGVAGNDNHAQSLAFPPDASLHAPPSPFFLRHSTSTLATATQTTIQVGDDLPSTRPRRQSAQEVDYAAMTLAESEDNDSITDIAHEGGDHEDANLTENSTPGLTKAEQWELDTTLYKMDKDPEWTDIEGNPQEKARLMSCIKNRKYRACKISDPAHVERVRIETARILQKRVQHSANSMDDQHTTLASEPDHQIGVNVVTSAEQQYPTPHSEAPEPAIFNAALATGDDDAERVHQLELQDIHLRREEIRLKLDRYRSVKMDCAPLHDVVGDFNFVHDLKPFLRAHSESKSENWMKWTCNRVLGLLDVARPPAKYEALFLSGEAATNILSPGQFFSGPIFTEGQQPLDLHSVKAFFNEHYDDDVGVDVQDPSINLSSGGGWCREKKMSAVKAQFAGPTGQYPWNCLEMACPLDDGVRPKFLNQEDCRLLTKVKFPTEKKAARHGYPEGWKEVEKWTLLAQAGAITGPHQDSHGYSTYITVQEGMVGFGWLSNPTPSERAAWIEDTNEFTGGSWRYVILRPGQTVVFPSSTVHFVFRSPKGGNTLAFGGHYLRCSQIERWIKTILEEQHNANITNEDLTASAPGYLAKVEKFVLAAEGQGNSDLWGGKAAIARFLELKRQFTAKHEELRARTKGRLISPLRKGRK